MEVEPGISVSLDCDKQQHASNLEDFELNRSPSLDLGSFGSAGSGKIQLHFPLDGTVKFLFPQTDETLQLVTTPTQTSEETTLLNNQVMMGFQVLNTSETSIANEISIANENSVQHCNSMMNNITVGNEQYDVPSGAKQNLPKVKYDSSAFQNETQRIKFITRKMKTIASNIEELYKKAGITAIAFATVDDGVKFLGPDHLSNSKELTPMKMMFWNIVANHEEPALEKKHSNGQGKTSALLWQCDECTSSFTTQHNLLNHKLLSHSGIEAHKCNICTKEFVDITVFQKHLTTHSNQNSFQCKMCGNTFAGKNILNSHMKIHYAEKQHKCKVCLRSFSSASSLQFHSKKHAESLKQKCICKHCNKEFTKMSSLKVHLRTHSGEQPYRCQECGKGFIVSTHLTRHLRTHSGERPYVCEVCGKRFNRSSHLRIHFRIHSGEKPYSCPICNKRFNQTVSRKKHLKTHVTL